MTSELERALRDAARQPGGLTFRRFMELALYGPGGYYTEAVHIGGAAGDFYTAAQSPLFAAVIAKYVCACYDEWERPEAVQIVEFGAGQGELAAQLLTAVLRALPPDVHLTYSIVERSERLRSEQQRVLCRHEGLEEGLAARHVRWGEPLRALPTVVIGNEVLDAFPIERVKRSQDGWLQAMVVNQEDGSFVVRWRQAPPEVARLAARWLPIPVGAIGEVCPDYADFFRAVGQLGPPLKALFFDYGITQEEWAAGLRPEGTVRAYARHMLVDALAAPGAQDITADVHWDHVCASARAAGLHVRGLTPQGSFLIQHGILEAFEQWQQAAQGEAARLRTVPMAGQLKQLIFPGGMGERFQVLECERAE